jgi:outer membrane protein
VKTLAVSLVVVATLCAATTLSAQTQRIGFVNSAKIFQELPESKDAQKRIDAITKPYQDTLEAKQRDLQAKYEEYQKKEGMMNDAAKKSAQQELLALEQGFNEYRLEKFGADGDVAKQTEKILAPLKEKILKAIERVAKEERYSFIFDQTEQVKVLLYGDSTHDLTFKVIDKLKRGK